MSAKHTIFYRHLRVWAYGSRAPVSSFFEKFEKGIYKFRKIQNKIIDIDNNKIY
jgi:hypothetical protein